MELFALIIPILLSLGGYYLYKHSIVWWELAIPIVVGLLVIIITKATVKTILVSDNEYWGSTVVEARYYEYWETWVDATCTREVACGTDSKGNTQYCTETYDCSYCDHNNARWKAYDNVGNEWEITEKYYNYLKQKWSSIPTFVELNRDIDTHGSCGQDGDMYKIKWDGQVMTSEGAVTIHSYENKVQASHSAFKLPYVSEKEAKKNGLYKYPEIYDYYKQKVVLGLDSIYNNNSVQYTETLFQYFNANYGPINHVKLYVLLFYDKPLSIAKLQEAYWDGGNQNELVVCIGLNRQTKEIQWVSPFSWSDQKRVLVDIREDISELSYFTPITVYNIIQNSISSNIMYKDFKKDFSYLDVDIPTGAMWLIYILTTILSIVAITICIKNDVNQEDATDSANTVFYEISTAYSNLKQQISQKIDKLLKL